MPQISMCKRCYLWNISGENHQCVLTGISFIQHSMRNGRAYIVKVSVDGVKWRNIDPIPSFMQIESEREIRG